MVTLPNLLCPQQPLEFGHLPLDQRDRSHGIQKFHDIAAPTTYGRVGPVLDPQGDQVAANIQ